MFSSFPEVSQKDLKKIKRTIKILSQLLTDLKIEYRIFGSIIPAAILGKSHRKLGDIDVMIDLKDKDILLERLKKEGYRLKQRSFRFLSIDFTWGEAAKSNLLELTIFLGKFDQDKNFIANISKNLKLVVHSRAIKPTLYSFYGSKFIGIPATTGYYGTLASLGNPKRKYDLAVFQAKKIPKPKKGYAVIDFYYKNKKLKFLYSFSCFLQDILGRLSLFFGGNYDFWRK